jgi:hypothetical protein
VLEHKRDDAGRLTAYSMYYVFKYSCGRVCEGCVNGVQDEAAEICTPDSMQRQGLAPALLALSAFSCAFLHREGGRSGHVVGCWISLVGRLERGRRHTAMTFLVACDPSLSNKQAVLY